MISIHRTTVQTIEVTPREAREIALKWLKGLIGGHFIVGNCLMVSEEHPHNGSIDRSVVGPVVAPENMQIVAAIQMHSAIRAMCHSNLNHKDSGNTGACHACGEKLTN